MRYIKDSLAHLFGYRVPRPPKEQQSAAVQAVYARKKTSFPKRMLKRFVENTRAPFSASGKNAVGRP